MLSYHFIVALNLFYDNITTIHENPHSENIC